MPPRKRPATRKICKRPAIRFCHPKVAVPKKPVRVKVAGLGGAHLDAIFDASTTTRQLKTLLANVWQVPPSCQNLLCGTRPLKDLDSINDNCASNSCSVFLTLVLSMEKVCEDVRSSTAKRCLRALADLEKLGLRGGDASICAICDSLRAYITPRRVGKAALSALKAATGSGSKYAIDEVTSLIQLSNLEIEDVVEAIEIVAGKGNHDVVDSVLAQVTSSDLMMLDGFWNDEYVIRGSFMYGPDGAIPLELISAGKCCADRNRSGQKSIGEVHEDGTLHWSDGQVWFPEDRHQLHRRHSNLFMSLDAECRSYACVKALTYLAHENDQTRSYARTIITSINRVSADFDLRRVIRAAAVQNLDHQHGGVRRTALELLEDSDIGEQTVVTRVVACLVDDDLLVQLKALETLAVLSAQNDKEVIKAVSAFLIHEERDLRRLALVVLARLVS